MVWMGGQLSMTYTSSIRYPLKYKLFMWNTKSKQLDIVIGKQNSGSPTSTKVQVSRYIR